MSEGGGKREVGVKGGFAAAMAQNGQDVGGVGVGMGGVLVNER